MIKPLLHTLILLLAVAGYSQTQPYAFAKGADVGWLPQMEATA
jgi:hypothetical protein